MDISKIKGILNSCYLADDALLLRGVHGIGKSEIVKEFGIENNFYVEVLFLSVMDETDIQGMPYIENNVEKFAPPSFMERMHEEHNKGKKCILMLDELNRASKYLQSAVFELILNKRVNEHSLPHNTLIVAAINPSDSIYNTSEMDPALLDRFCVVDVEVNHKTWILWAIKNNIKKVITDFITKYPEYLHKMDSNEEGPTPRSWSKLNKHLDNFNILNNEEQYNIINGKIGKEIGLIFYDFYKNYVEKDIINVVKEVYTNINNFKNEINEDNIDVISKKLEWGLYNTPTIVDVCKYIFNNYFNEKNNRDQTMELLIILYSLNKEILVNVLREFKKSPRKYLKLASLDFNKKLFKSLILF